MSTARAAATRSNVVRMRRRLDQVNKGAALLKKKRESLVTELLSRARPAVDARKAIDAQAHVAWRALLGALGNAGASGLTAQGWPTREVRIELEPIEVWGVRAVALGSKPSLVRSLAARCIAPGLDDAEGPLAAAELERLVEQLIDQAPREQLMRRLGVALARTSRLVNTLEQKVAVSLNEGLGFARRTLDEREREEHLRLSRIVARRRAQEQEGAAP